MKKGFSEEKTIRSIVKSAVESYAEGFKARHDGEVDNPAGTINMKIHNVFIAALGSEIQYYAALVRSLDSSLGNMLEKMAINIAELFFIVKRNVEGPLTSKQTQKIAELLEQYKRRDLKPCIDDYQVLRNNEDEVPRADILKVKKNNDNVSNGIRIKRHDSDYYLINEETKKHFLIELKIGGDLDNKKARSEKEAILEQYAILSNTLPRETDISIYFATAYNRFGENKPWKQERVRQYFCDDELLIGKDFWDFICQSEEGFSIVLDEYKKNAEVIKDALKAIKRTYLGD